MNNLVDVKISNVFPICSHSEEPLSKSLVQIRFTEAEFLTLTDICAF